MFISGTEYLPILVGIATGGAVSFMFTYDYKNANWKLILPIIVLLIVLLMPIIFMSIPQYVPGKDGNVIYTLMCYVDRNFMTPEHASSILHKIGWTDIDITKYADGSISVVSPL